jgi:hypothetical protein
MPATQTLAAPDQIIQWSHACIITYIHTYMHIHCEQSHARNSDFGGSNSDFSKVILVCGSQATRTRQSVIVSRLKSGRCVYTHFYEPEATHLLCR